MDYQTYKGHGIRVYQHAAFGRTKWIFDQRDNRLVRGQGIADSEVAALAAARKWIDAKPSKKPRRIGADIQRRKR